NRLHHGAVPPGRLQRISPTGQDRPSPHVRLPGLRRRRAQRDHRAPGTRRAGLLTAGTTAAELLPRRAWPVDRSSARQLDRAESSKALTAAAADARLSIRGGGSEKQVADHLGLSHDTTHQYVTALYRHFGVGSRAQLMAYVLKRIGRGEWRQFPPGIA